MAGAASRRVVQIAVLLLPALVFLTAWFLVPLVSFLQLAFEHPQGALHPFRVILESPVYVRVFVNSLILATNVTVICVVLAYPAAYLLSRLKGTLYYVGVYCVLFPLWISVLVRTYSWMLLLERNGPVNRFLQELGVTDAPVQLMFNDTGVYIGMVHVLLPYALLPIYAAMSRIDGRLLQASDGLGASLLDTFFRVYLPLTMPGVLGGAFFVFGP
jgi:putative spermidine/putrescine transport system permease protein